MGNAEKRAHPRRIVHRAVAVRSAAGDQLDGTVENLGALGALVSTADLETVLAVGDQVSLRVRFDDDDAEVDLAGTILRLDQEFVDGDIRRTFAVKFEKPVDTA